MSLRHWMTSLAVVAVTAAPAFAQDNHDRRGNRDRSQQSQQSQPLQQSQQTERQRREQSAREQPQAERAPQQRQADRAPQQRQADRAPQQRQNDRAIPRTVEPPREREQVQRREDQARRENDQRRVYPDRSPVVVPRQEDSRRENVQRNDQAARNNDQAWRNRNDVQRRNDDRWRDDARPNVQVRRDTAIPRVYTQRGYSGRTYELRRWDAGRYGEPLRYRYGYGPRIIRPTIIQVVPYRPYVYRPSWSFGVYYGYDGYYPYGYTPDYYFHPIPGRYYGGVRITGAPREARVFADGYFVGIVDDFDGIFQHLNLEAGPHHIDIVLDGYEPVAFDVNVRPGETITFRAEPYFFQPY